MEIFDYIYILLFHSFHTKYGNRGLNASTKKNKHGWRTTIQQKRIYIYMQSRESTLFKQ